MGFGPPVEVGASFEEVGRGFEGAAAFGDDGVELLDGFEVFVGDGLVEHRPEAFGRALRPERPIFLKISECRCGLVVLPFTASRGRYPGKLGLAKMRC